MDLSIGYLDHGFRRIEAVTAFVQSMSMGLASEARVLAPRITRIVKLLALRVGHSKRVAFSF